MEGAIANVSCRSALHHNRLTFSRPISSLSVRPPPPPSSPLSIKASSSSFDHEKPPVSSLLKSASAATATVIVAGTLFFARSKLKFAIAGPFWQLFKSKEIATFEENTYEVLDDFVVANPNNIQELKNLMEWKVMNHKMDDAIRIAKRLVELQPEVPAWSLLKAHFHYYIGDLEMAKREFNEVASRHPCQAEAYRGLIMVASLSESNQQLKEMKEIEKRVKKAMEMEINCTKMQFRNLKLLIPQILVIEEDFLGALKAYQELIMEDPRDFRPHLYLGIIFTLLKYIDEAEEHLEEYNRLVHQGQQYADYFDSSMILTTIQFGKEDIDEEEAKRS